VTIHPTDRKEYWRRSEVRYTRFRARLFEVYNISEARILVTDKLVWIGNIVEFPLVRDYADANDQFLKDGGLYTYGRCIELLK